MSRPVHGSSTAPRLVAFIQELAITDAKLSHRYFTERLAQLIDLSDSITLSEHLRSLKRLRFQAPEQIRDAETLKADFLQARGAMTEAIVRRFVPDAGSLAFDLPIPSAEAIKSKGNAFEPYQRFYSFQQSEMDYQVLKLRQQVRDVVGGVSREMAQLVALDRTLADTLALESRRLLALVPKLLGKRFTYWHQKHITDEPAPGHADADWLAPFFHEMQGLLLAELDMRLLPVVGLIEALDEEVNQKP